MSAKNQVTANASGTGTIPDPGLPGTGKSAFLMAASNQPSNPGTPINWHRYSLDISGLDDDLFLDPSPVVPDFSSATAAVVTETSWSDINLRQRLAEQLERDAEKIRKSCAIVRDPSKPREITYADPNELMGITRLVCGG